ncbi:replication initiator [Arthrobacter sp. 3Tela_A]|uniref:replication initiator n=1 Tax=Arthrobacter sp. 3Tela_A TaxID=3093743 RepID=UPI003BB51168
MSVASDHVLGQALVEKHCVKPHPVFSQEGIPLLVRCGSRVPSDCPSCSRQYRGDWGRILRSGCLPSGDVALNDLLDSSFYLLTLTAPSFGKVHRVPKRADSVMGQCSCGSIHTHEDVNLAGVPVDFDTYRYLDAVKWNNYMPELWDYTRLRLRRLIPGFAYAAVREWQQRGLLHMHVLVRVPRSLAPTEEELARVARETVVNRAEVTFRWGKQVDVKEIACLGTGATDIARSIGYLAKTLGYTQKSWGETLPLSSSRQYRRHVAKLDSAARDMRCRRCSVLGSVTCKSKAHQRFGATTALATISRESKSHAGWSLANLNRTRLKAERAAWAATSGEDDGVRWEQQQAAIRFWAEPSSQRPDGQSEQLRLRKTQMAPIASECGVDSPITLSAFPKAMNDDGPRSSVAPTPHGGQTSIPADESPTDMAVGARRSPPPSMASMTGVHWLH